MEIKDILALAHAGFTAEQINQLNNQAQSETARPQMVQPQMVQPQTAQPQMVQPQTVQPQMVQPQPAQPQMVQPQTAQPQMQISPFGVPFMGQLTPAPMPPVPANNPSVADQGEKGTASPNVPGNPSPEQLAGQLARAQATNLNGVTVAPAQKVSIEEKLQNHYMALMGAPEDKKGE